MADIKQEFGSSTAITITLASLTATPARGSLAIDNATNKFLDAIVFLAIELQTGTPASDQAINVYVYGSEDGTNFTDNSLGTDANITLRSPTNLKLVEIINTPDSGGVTYKSHPISIAKAFGGVMPREWGIVVENKTNITFSATEGDHTKTYTGIFATV